VMASETGGNCTVKDCALVIAPCGVMTVIGLGVAVWGTVTTAQVVIIRRLVFIRAPHFAGYDANPRLEV
jgi:hypothetical protein